MRQGGEGQAVKGVSGQVDKQRSAQDDKETNGRANERKGRRETGGALDKGGMR